MTQARPRDVIGHEPRERRAPSLPLLAVAGASLLLGVATGVLWSQSRSVGDVPAAQVGSDQPGEGGLVTVCDGRAHAFVYARALPDEPTQVRLPLGSGGAMLPLMTDRAVVLSGRTPVSLVGFVPQDGHLALVQELPVPPGDQVSAEVGDRALSLLVRGCGRGER